MFKSTLLALTTSLMLGTVTAQAAPERIELLTENFPPYNMAVDGKNFARDENIHGIATDIIREMFKRAGVDYSLTLRFPWERIYKMALENPGYGVFVTARLPEREELFKWVGPIGPDDWVLLARGDSSIEVSSLDDARQYRIGAYKGDAIGEHLLAQGLEPSLALRDQANVEKLQNGSIDLWATGDPAGRFLAKQEGITGFKRVLRFDSAELYLALNKQTSDETLSKLQDALEQMRADGTIETINARYL
ncbi:ABC transporter substrate-binding protein [Stutzerimonas zhaodongensis]|uniref:ABC transporter substrate-binding protein n=1 Tax=Stutzerimonas zhaodongensis TaxID=1176257 RepID=A0A3M2HZS3_9GAMM|nr:ABC transporter substrate-binding protein [Stutzerimonas zhaodongensis]MCQ4315758.1 ABC transporter substrate-binding protein [Stutzerimonas zhaodongensis]RMH91384.1 ABC transporter substrate-binding protein [Stutzerimonas zhaodongensis]